ncbi:MAG: hypothetical protein IT391_06090 [Nitrospira sp.]|nr:hypothetical protein [Nitrospira sp.]
MKNAICQILFLLVVALAVPTGAVGDAYDFKLVMSQDKNLCPAISEVLSTEYSAIGIQDPPRHEWFVKWEPLSGLNEQFREEPQFNDDHCSIYRWAMFDIDNDGQAELVIKWSACLGGIRSDHVYIFRSDEPREGISETLLDRAPWDSTQGKVNRERLLGQINYTGQWYELRKLPPFKDDRGHSQLHGIGGKVWIYPFMFGGQTYLNLHGLSGMHVIARYKRPGKIGEKLEDVCYVDRRKR